MVKKKMLRRRSEVGRQVKESQILEKAKTQQSYEEELACLSGQNRPGSCRVDEGSENGCDSQVIR